MLATIGERLKNKRQANTETQANTAQTTAFVLRNVELEVTTQLKVSFFRALIATTVECTRVVTVGAAAGRTIAWYRQHRRRQAAGTAQAKQASDRLRKQKQDYKAKPLRHNLRRNVASE